MSATQQDPLARLVQAVKQYDEKLNTFERCPTGDDYNVLYQLVLDLARGLAESTVPTGAFTEGPWHVEPTEGNPNSLSICKAGLCVIAEINRADEPLVEADHHDAALIAAAPELANAVRDTLIAYNQGFDLPWGTLRRAYATIFPQPIQGA